MSELCERGFFSPSFVHIRGINPQFMHLPEPSYVLVVLVLSGQANLAASSGFASTFL